MKNLRNLKMISNFEPFISFATSIRDMHSFVEGYYQNLCILYYDKENKTVFIYYMKKKHKKLKKYYAWAYTEYKFQSMALKKLNYTLKQLKHNQIQTKLNEINNDFN